MSSVQSRSGYTLSVRRAVRFAIVVAAVASSSCAAPRIEQSCELCTEPQSVKEFQSFASIVLRDTGVPGAGIALVRQSGIEWAGGVGLADRDQGIPVTADTRFRVGSISKSVVAIALVQLSEDGSLELDAPVAEAAPDIVIDNRWEATAPVTILNLLQHTAGFDDMHFNEMYVPHNEPDRPLAEVMRLNPRSRRVRWQPGTRMSYSNPGYGLAGLILENTVGEPYEDYIAREIFEPLGMTNSTFRSDEHAAGQLARGYRGVDGPPVEFRRIYHRPAGNMMSTPHDLGRFIHMLLGWGELGDAFVIDPEYLGNMEQPQTSVAAAAGLRNGYGSGIFTFLDLPYKMLGHNGGIDGFLSSYAYSPSRDVGYVILLNSTGAGAGEAMRRLSALAISYLKRDVEPPAKPEVKLDPAALDHFVGYYHDANPRNQIAWPVQTLFSGQTIVRVGDSLFAEGLFRQRERLIPVSDAMFRRENEVDASIVFTQDSDGGMVMTGPQLYAERTSRWRLDALRIALTTALVVIASVFLVAVIWVARIRRAQPRGFWELKVALLLCPIMLLAPVAGLALTPLVNWGSRNPGTLAVYIGSLAIPGLAVLISILVVLAIRERASRWLVTYAALVAFAMAGLSLYLGSHDMLALKLWSY